MVLGIHVSNEMALSQLLLVENSRTTRAAEEHKQKKGKKKQTNMRSKLNIMIWDRKTILFKNLKLMIGSSPDKDNTTQHPFYWDF